MPQLELSALGQPEDIRRYLQNSWKKEMARQALTATQARGENEGKYKFQVNVQSLAQPPFNFK